MRTVQEAAATVKHDALAWAEAVQRASDLAHARLPKELHGRIERATALVLAGDVVVEEDGHTAQVRSSDGATWYAANGTCPCEDYPRAPDNMCKHRLAWMTYRRAGDIMRQGLPAPATALDDSPVPASPVPVQCITHIQGKPFIKFAGLLQLAIERGLTSLTAEWTYNDDNLSLAQAVAVFQDGRRFVECGDATPTNVTPRVAPHYRRVALTRAKARVLRDALGIDMVAVEEMAELD